MNMSIKEIINNATTEMEQAIETIKKLKERLGQPIDGTRPLTETEQLCIDMEHSVERLNDFLKDMHKKMLKEVNTPVGTIYIEDFLFREEDDRIKIYDSDKKYLDYISLETIEEEANKNHCFCIKVIERYMKNMKKCSTLAELLDCIVYIWDEYSVDWEVIADRLVERIENQINSVGELLENEWVNRIGDYYILMPEC